jgi:alpha-L-rhamnosidase
MTKRYTTAVLTISLLCGGGGIGAQVQTKPDPLLQGFENPPSSARPRVWWHWMNGNISEPGIKLDLEWMHREGLAGFQTFDAALATPQVVPHRLVYMTPEWKDAFRYATTIADQLGMEEAIAGSPGWSETGGPWVPASQGMKKYVWSETDVEGGQTSSIVLPHPPANTGAFQNLPIHDELEAPDGTKPIPQFYADSIVIAYRRPAIDAPFESLHPTVTSSGGALDIAILTDGDLLKTTDLAIPAAGADAWIQYEFPQPETMRAITIVTKDVRGFTAALAGLSNPKKTLQASDDGQTFRTVKELPNGGAPEQTVSFPAVTAKYFRVVFTKTPPPPLPAWAKNMDPKTLGIKMSPPPTAYKIAELELHPGPRVDRFEEKAAFVPVPDLYEFATPPVDPKAVIQKGDVVDLTSKMRPDGTLDWTPPPGKWVILRFGYSLLGITNHPATAEATGLEVDKLNRAYVKSYMSQYLDSYKDTVGADNMGKRGIKYVITDSWEAGSQNWTDDMIAEFKTRRGYDPTPWMPVLTGHIVESSEASDAFLWDFRKTIADLTADEHYGQVQASLKERGMGHYGESHESGRAFIADGMEVKKLDDIPMGAMWTQVPGVNEIQYNYNADDRESASVAHIYGQNIAAAESMTAAAAPWGWSPATLKPTADQELLNGINRFVIHESAHQPLVGKGTKPGLTLGPFGQWFNRNETWAEDAGSWVSYLARSSYMLQQGRFDADLIYFYGEDSNLTAIFNTKAPNVPAGYGFDYINADGLIHELSVSNGRMTTRSGMSYRVLGLDPYSKHMSLPVLRAIHQLVEAGAVVAGPQPIDDPSIADDHAEFKKLNAELFGDGTGVHHVGKGTVYAGQDLADVFQTLAVAPDFDYTKPEKDTRILFAHRKLPDGDIYFVDNRSDHDQAVDASFRVTGKIPMLWYAETGTTQPVSYKIADGRTTVPLQMEPWGTVFVVFRKPTTQPARTIPAPVSAGVVTVNGPWTVSFTPDLGAPPSITLPNLISWSDSTDAGVKYFSGSGTYTKTVHVPESLFKKNAQLWIDLGSVKNLADVTVNGKNLGTVWHAPYRVDATGALKPGDNEVTIKVTNAWVNRLIGDQQPDATTKYTSTDVKPYSADSPLLPSGLLGPVQISSITTQP